MKAQSKGVYRNRLWASAFLACVAIQAQTAVSAVSLGNGLQLRITTALPAASVQQTLRIEMIPASGNSFYRIFRDQNDLAVYAYELAVNRPAGGNDFRLTALPVLAAFASKVPDADGGKPTPTISEPRELSAPPTGPVSFEVFETAGQEGKVVDSIEVKVRPGGSAAGGSALRFSELGCTVNGQPLPSASNGTVSGDFAMFYVPGRGGYFFSTAQPEGKAFVEAGSVDGARLRFTIDNENYECASRMSILPREAHGEVWVYRDPGYQPKGNWTKPLDDQSADSQPASFFTAASNTLGWWVP